MDIPLTPFTFENALEYKVARIVVKINEALIVKVTDRNSSVTVSHKDLEDTFCGDGNIDLGFLSVNIFPLYTEWVIEPSSDRHGFALTFTPRPVVEVPPADPGLA